jgi:L-aspartate oxidase
MRLPQRVDFIVVGAGIAGLRAAIGLAGAGTVLVVTKEQLAESNTQYAQGGIAVAMGGDEDISLHCSDTISAGDGIVSAAAAAVLVREGPARVEELLAWGTGFDREGGELARTLEGAHSRSRILHANGDATGREIGRALLHHARTYPSIQLAEWLTTAELIVSDGRVTGVSVLDESNVLHVVQAKAVLLASGGAGQVYSDTTNPSVATGDGIAMAWRAGAEIADMEFFQFHPTALSLPGVQRFLLSEALRGEGAYLRNHLGERFMQKYHPLLELAPRDVVARAITRESSGAQSGESLPVYLDMRHVTEVDLQQRFPGITTFLGEQNLSLATDLIPVRPAAHYLMGGVRTDLDGRASMPGLYAAGAAACTGVHGANRLASNSLLEGLVFGARAGEAMRDARDLSGVDRGEAAAGESAEGVSTTIISVGDLRRKMWEQAGLLRDATALKEMRSWLSTNSGLLPAGTTRQEIETKNLHAVASLIVHSALRREESRGAHFRIDFPTRDDDLFQKHSVVRGQDLSFESTL